MRKKIVALILMFAMVFSFMPNVSADAKIGLNTKAKTITVGKTSTIKIKGTKKAAWTVSNNRISIIKKTKTSAKIKAVRKGTSYLKAKVGRKTYKCKITVKEKENRKKTNNEEAPSTDMIGYKLLNTRNGVIAILTNNNECSVKLNATLVYYKSGTPLGASTESNYAFEKGNTCAFSFQPPLNHDFSPVEYDDYQINISVESASYLVCAAKSIGVKPNIGFENVFVTVSNNSSENLLFITMAIVYYDSNGNAIGYECKSADCLNIGAISYLTFDFPHDENYQMITPSSYEIFVNDAYTYTWMK